MRLTRPPMMPTPLASNKCRVSSLSRSFSRMRSNSLQCRWKSSRAVAMTCCKLFGQVRTRRFCEFFRRLTSLLSGIRATSSKLHTPSSHDTLNFNLKNRPPRRLPRPLFWGLVFEIWNFFGAWELVLGVSLSSAPNTERRPRISRFPVCRPPCFYLGCIPCIVLNA